MIETVRNAIDETDAQTDGESAPDATTETDGRGDGSSTESWASTEPTDAEDSGVEYDQLFEILKNQRRRHVLRYLGEADGSVTLGELAEQIAARETGKDVSQISSQERKRVYVGLYQCHLPKMDDVGAIEYNKPRGRVEPAESTPQFEHYLPEKHEPDEQTWTWTSYHAGLAAVLAVTVLALLVFGVVEQLPQLLLGSVVGLLVAVPLVRYVD
jgi:hypothetical protein